MHPEYPQFFEVEATRWELEQQNQQQEWPPQEQNLTTKVREFLGGVNQTAENWFFKRTAETDGILSDRRLHQLAGMAIALMFLSGVKASGELEKHNTVVIPQAHLLEAEIPEPQPGAGDRRYPAKDQRKTTQKTIRQLPTTSLPPTTTSTATTLPPKHDTAVPFSIRGHGIDISFPQCGPSKEHPEYPNVPLNQMNPYVERTNPNPDFIIIGLNDGTPFTVNPCLADEVKHYGAKNMSVYVNTVNTGNPDPKKDGYEAGKHAVQIAKDYGVRTDTYWLDVESANPWSKDEVANHAEIQGEIEAIRKFGADLINHEVVVGFYSNAGEWKATMGNSQVDSAVIAAHWQDMPAWVASGFHDEPMPWARRHCTGSNFTGGKNTPLIQLAKTDPDQDFSCQ